MADIDVTIVYATPTKQVELPVKVADHANIAIAIKASSLLTDFPELVLEELSVGVNSSVLALDSPVSSGDRVEVYRPLLVDPKEARRKRAQKK
jgi:uncharacterized protein